MGIVGNTQYQQMNSELFNQLKQSLEECIMIKKWISDTEYLVESELFFNPVDITKECHALASQENCDEHEHNMLYKSAQYINYLRTRLSGEKLHNAELIKHNKDLLREIG